MECRILWAHGDLGYSGWGADLPWVPDAVSYHGLTPKFQKQEANKQNLAGKGVTIDSPLMI